MCVQFTLNNETMIHVRSIYGAPCLWYRCAGQEDIFYRYIWCVRHQAREKRNALYICPMFLRCQAAVKDEAMDKIPDTNYTTIVSATVFPV